MFCNSGNDSERKEFDSEVGKKNDLHQLFQRESLDHKNILEVLESFRYKDISKMMIQQDEKGNLPIHYAAQHPALIKDMFRVKKILKILKKTINHQNIKGQTPLHKASESCCGINIKSLLQNGAFVIGDKNGAEPQDYTKDPMIKFLFPSLPPRTPKEPYAERVFTQKKCILP